MVECTSDCSEIHIGEFVHFGASQLFSKASIFLKYSSEANAEKQLTFHVFMCVSVKSFTDSVYEINIVQGKTLAALIIFGIAMILVMLFTFGLSYEVSHLIFRPLKVLLRKLRNMQF